MLQPALAEVGAGLGGVALFTAAGAGLVELLGLRRLTLGPRLAYAYLLGVAWVAGGLYAGSHFWQLPLNRTSTLVLAGLPVAAGLAGFAIRFLGGRSRPARTRPARDRSGRRRPPLPIVLAVAVGTAVTLGLLVEALANPLTDWDGRMTWASQARYLRAAGTVDAPVLMKDKWYITHPQYPLLLPLAQVAVLEVFDAGEDEQPFRPLYAAFFPAFLLVLWHGARRSVGRRAAGWTVLAASAAPFLAAGEGGAAGGYSDVPLSCFYGAALLLLLRARPRLGDGLTAGLLLAAAALAKKEGAILAGFALAAAVWAALRGLRPGPSARARLRSLVPVATAAVLALAAVLLFFSWRAPIPNRFDEGYEKFGTAALWPAALTRIPILLPPVFSCFFSWDHWTTFWWAAPVVLLAGRRGFRRRVAPPLALAWMAPLIIAWGAYTVHTSPLYMVTVTWDRMLIQGGIPFFLLLAMALRQVLLDLGGAGFPLARWRTGRRDASAPRDSRLGLGEKPVEAGEGVVQAVDDGLAGVELAPGRALNSGLARTGSPGDSDARP
jgi:hypothetical protein